MVETLTRRNSYETDHLRILVATDIKDKMLEKIEFKVEELTQQFKNEELNIIAVIQKLEEYKSIVSVLANDVDLEEALIDLNSDETMVKLTILDKLNSILNFDGIPKIELLEASKSQLEKAHERMTSKEEKSSKVK